MLAVRRDLTNDRANEREDELNTVATVKVPISALRGNSGVVAREVKARDGSTILPAGVDISMFNATMDVLVKKMRVNSITHVFLSQKQQLKESDVEHIINRVYSDTDSLINKEKAATVVKHVHSLFTELQEGEFNTKVMDSMAMMSEDLAYDLMQNPEVAFSLGRVKDADEYTFIHSFNVSLLTGYLANRLHPGNKDLVERIVLGGLMHDIGKAKIPSAILNKPGPLDQQELTIMQKHPALGLGMAIAGGVTDSVILAVIGGHHEKWSGKGYPKRTAGENIPEAARIAAVADVFDALTAKRVYKQPMSSRNAITLIMKDAGTHFDARVARELLVGLGLYPPGSIVLLSDARKGIVVSGNGSDLLRPVVLIQHGNNAEDFDTPEFVDLKTETGIRIAEYLGHGSKRDLGIKEMIQL